MQTIIYSIFNSTGQKIAYTSIRTNITDKKRLEKISIKDGLTNIYNRRHFNNIMTKIFTNHQNNDNNISFILIDIDNFKKYNDTYGHPKGDIVIKSVANVMNNILNKIDVKCFRIGGEEFAFLLNEKYTKEKAIGFAE